MVLVPKTKMGGDNGLRYSILTRSVTVTPSEENRVRADTTSTVRKDGLSTSTTESVGEMEDRWEAVMPGNLG